MSIEVVRPNAHFGFARVKLGRRVTVRVCRTCLAHVSSPYEHAVWHAERGDTPKHSMILGLDDETVSLHLSNDGAA